MKKKINNNIAGIIGTSCVGKTTLGKAAAEATGAKFIEIEDIFIKKYGGIHDFSQKYGWKKIYYLQSKISRDIFKSVRDTDKKTILVFPASIFRHNIYLKTAEVNMREIYGRLRLICVLADRNDRAGAKKAVERQVKKGYITDWAYRLRQYMIQAALYKKIADKTLVNIDLKKTEKALVSYLKSIWDKEPRIERSRK